MIDDSSVACRYKQLFQSEGVHLVEEVGYDQEKSAECVLGKI